MELTLTTEYGEIVFNSMGVAIAYIWKFPSLDGEEKFIARLLHTAKTNTSSSRQAALKWVDETTSGGRIV